jgi:hypothetical protein
VLFNLCVLIENLTVLVVKGILCLIMVVKYTLLLLMESLEGSAIIAVNLGVKDLIVSSRFKDLIVSSRIQVKVQRMAVVIVAEVILVVVVVVIVVVVMLKVTTVRKKVTGSRIVARRG